MDAIIETERLYLRHILPSDVEGMFLMYSDPDVMDAVGGQYTRTTREQVLGDIEIIRKQNVTGDCIGRFAVIRKETNEFIGWTGLKDESDVNSHDHFIDQVYSLTHLLALLLAHSLMNVTI